MIHKYAYETWQNLGNGLHHTWQSKRPYLSEFHIRSQGRVGPGRDAGKDIEYRDAHSFPQLGTLHAHPQNLQTEKYPFSFIVELRFEYSPKLVPSHITVKVLGPLLILATHIRSPACRASDRRGLSRSSRSPTTSFHVFPTLPDATSFRRSGEVFRRLHPHLT